MRVQSGDNAHDKRAIGHLRQDRLRRIAAGAVNMEFWGSLAGMLTVEFTSADPENTLDAIIKAEIPLTRVVEKKKLTYQMQIRRKDFRKLSAILKRQGSQPVIIRKQGIYWVLQRLLHRPVLVSTFFLLLISSVYLPSRIFFVAVEGNTAIPDRQILTAAEDCGIRFGASRKRVRSEKVKNALLACVPQLQWAGINTSGCTAVISVKERVSEAHEPMDAKTVSNLIAERDGYIVSMTITGGTGLVFPGQAVTKGQMLVSGYTDCGFCIRAARAEGEIVAQTSRNVYSVTPASCLISTASGNTKCNISLLIGKKRINLWKDSRISDTGCGRMYEEYFVYLPGGYRLPVAICMDRYIPYEIQETRISEPEAEFMLQEFSDRYLERQMVAGQILREEHTFSDAGRLYQLSSSYSCREIIGKEQIEQTGVINGKRN